MSDFKAEDIKTTKITLKISNIDGRDKKDRKQRTSRTKVPNSRRDSLDSQSMILEDSDFEAKKSKKPTTTKVKIKRLSIDNQPTKTTSQKPEFGPPDSPSSHLNLENHFIVRVPEEISESVNEIVDKRGIGDDVEITFINNRKAAFRFKDQLYDATLMDLPTITESYRTTDKKQILKVADISQMLLVGEKISGFDSEKLNAPLEIKDIAYPHGLAPPLYNVSRRRFRHRISNAKIESIENEVLRLLKEDESAVSISYELQDLLLDSESTYQDSNSPDIKEHRFGTSIEADEDAESVMDMDDFDADLADEINRGLEELDDEDDMAEERMGESQYSPDGAEERSTSDGRKNMHSFSGKSGDKGSDDEEEEDSDEEASVYSEDNELNNERAMQRKLLIEEVSNLEATIKRKRADLNTAPNPIIRKRFEDTLQKLMTELEHKRTQLEAMNTE
ncbi:Transcription initiation factor TFIID subunit 7 [Smittium mucronatum]|uniref:Transcription initiation factor TFIID subunit 7 n=1 Tax=Smittium mucronatum TaxID=133383 RepID=A0A1R0GXF8_9FUNG|nr:Transcription initiation factor TFIID subunit 7 [Smittium mucronatum]